MENNIPNTNNTDHDSCPKSPTNGFISPLCQEHGHPFEMYCSSHDVIVCATCVPVYHGNCKDVRTLRDAAHDSKGSGNMVALHKSVESLLNNIKNLTHEKEIISKDLEKSKDAIKETIKTLRENVNKHLNEIEQSLILEVSNRYNSYQSKVKNEIEQLQKVEEKLRKLNQKTNKIRDSWDSVKTFIGIHQLQKTVNDLSFYLSSDYKTVEHYRLKVEIEPKLQSFQDDFNHFGLVAVDITKKDFPFIAPDKEQHKTIPKVDRVKARLNPLFSINIQRNGLMKVTDCLILPDGRVLVADYYGKNQLFVFDNKGDQLNSIRLISPPFGLALVDPNRMHIAVSFGTKPYIEILNIDNSESHGQINVAKRCFGISYYNDNLHIVTDAGIKVVDVHGEIKNTIQIDVAGIHHILVTFNQIFLTNHDTSIIRCYNMTGEELWSFKDEIMKGPLGLSLYEDNCICVVGSGSYNAITISRGGGKIETLLTEYDGLCRPQCIRYDNKHRLLIVCNSARKGLVYKLE